MSLIYGLYLAGGKSTRMGRPKRDLEHLGGKTFLEHAMGALSEVCDACYVSTGAETLGLSYPEILDAEEVGPLGGLLAAHAAFPKVSWLVLASDLPAVRAEDLALLVENKGKAETIAFSNPIDGVPEATATLYSPKALAQITTACHAGQRCLRHALEATQPHALPAPSPFTLQNVNYPTDYTEWKRRTESPNYHHPTEQEVTVEFYAKLRQDAGTERVSAQTSSITVAGVWEEMRLKYNLSLKQPSVKPAINNAFASWEQEITTGDLIAFMPPFAGG